MKVVIVTWQYPNYGTLLQAFALQNILERHQCDVQILNYETQKKDVVIFHRYSVKRQIKRIKAIAEKNLQKLQMRSVYKTEQKAIAKRNELYNEFILHELHMTERLEKVQLPSIVERFDVFVAGSDQIWSPKYLDGAFFLDFVNEKDKKKIAYAPSFGVNFLDDKTTNYIKPLLKEFNALSVRELQGLRILERDIGLPGKVTLDPTLLLTRFEWMHILDGKRSNNMSMPKQYILCYFLGNNQYYWNIVKKIQQALQIPVVVIPCTERAYKQKYKKIIQCGPFDFVRAISGAEYVVTDSFHGVAFSVNFKKQFLALARFKDADETSENSRVLSLLEILELQNRWKNWNTELGKEICISESEYDKAHNRLMKMREQSIAYLEKGLSKEE